MSIGEDDPIVIDTNALVHWVRQDSSGQHLLQQYTLDARAERPMYSTIAEGEIRALARCWNWGAAKLARLDVILAELIRVDVGQPEIVQAYTELYFEAFQGGHATGQNDLWIAATAKAANAVLLTFDADFNWMSPKLLRVETVRSIAAALKKPS